MTKGRPTIPDRRTAQVGGVLFVCAGAWLLFDAYDARGRQKPFWMKLLPGA